jgi:extracellular elastinolytic metalloproteinase
MVLVHGIQIQNDEAGTWHEALFDANSGEFVSATDFGAHATYRVIPFPKPDPNAGFEQVVDPENKAASPDGWSYDGTTAGNNAVAFYYRYIDDVSKKYDYTADFSKDPREQVNLDAARVQAFYDANMYHDFTYLYGFNEKAYNFQYNNYNKGGEAKDHVRISVQNLDKINNARFFTPPEQVPI